MNIFNLKSFKRDDYTTLYNFEADEIFSMPVTANSSVSIEVLWGKFRFNGGTYGTNLNNTDATAILQISTDSINLQNHPTMSTIYMNTPNGISGWQTALWKEKFLHVKLTRNSVTEGTIRLMVTTKENI